MGYPVSSEELPQTTEKEVIARAQRGDAAAFEYLYKAHSKHVYSVCLRMLRNTSEAEDLTQQVFLKLFRKIATFRGESVLSTWLHRVTVNAVLMHLRRKRPTEALVEDFHGDGKSALDQGESVRPDHSTRSAIDAMNLRRAINKLPATCKRYFVLHDVLGYRHDEIARLLGCTIGGSKSQLHRARKRLRLLLAAKESECEQGPSEGKEKRIPDVKIRPEVHPIRQIGMPSLEYSRFAG